MTAGAGETLAPSPVENPAVSGRFGLCPLCRGEDGYINCGRGHWFICKTHRLRWFAGSNLFGTWRDPEWRTPQARELFGTFAACDDSLPLRPPDVPEDIRASLTAVFEHLQSPKHAGGSPDASDEQAVLAAAFNVMWWLWGVPPDHAVLKALKRTDVRRR